MNLEQFSTEFDIAYNNVTSNASPPLNNFEKSVFLTRAQNDLVMIYYNGLNGRYTSFETSEECRRYLDSLVVHEQSLELKERRDIEGYKMFVYDKPSVIREYIDSVGDKHSSSFDLMLFIVRESAKKRVTDGCEANGYLAVRPVSYNDLTHCLKDPFKRPGKGKALRVDNAMGIGIISSEDITDYLCTYIQKPHPIILESLVEYGLNIEGCQKPLEPACGLPDVLHQKIVDRAVMLAKAAYVGEFNTQSTLSVQTL